MAINKTQDMVNTLKILSPQITYESLSQSVMTVFDTIANSLTVSVQAYSQYFILSLLIWYPKIFG